MKKDTKKELASKVRKLLEDENLSKPDMRKVLSFLYHEISKEIKQHK